MTEHVRQKNAVQEIDDAELISSAIDKCNLKPEYKRLLKILYVERGCLEDVCDAVGRERESYGKRGKKHDKFTREDADEWTEKMKNADGSTGRHWNFEQTEQVRRQHGYDCDPAEFYAAINMMYSDYYKIGKEFNLNSVDFYAAMAHAFLDDEDAGEDKLAKYYECIVEKH